MIKTTHPLGSAAYFSIAALTLSILPPTAVCAAPRSSLPSQAPAPPPVAGQIASPPTYKLGGGWTVSPDGGTVACQVQSVVDGKRHSELRIVAVGKPDTALQTIADAGAATWSPDSGTLAFVGSVGEGRERKSVLSLWSRKSGQVRVLDQVLDPGYNLRWSPDSRYLICQVSAPVSASARPASKTEPSRKPETTDKPAFQVDVQESDTAKAVRTGQETPKVDHVKQMSDGYTRMIALFAKAAVRDIALVEVSTGNVTYLMRGEHATPNFSVSPDFKHLIVTMFTHEVALSAYQYTDYSDWYLVPIPTPEQIAAVKEAPAKPEKGDVDFAGRPVAPCLTDATGSGIWSPNGLLYAYATDGAQSTHDVYTLDVVSGKTRNLTGNTPTKATAFSDLLWTPDDKSLVAFGRDPDLRHGQRSLWLISPTGDTPRKVTTKLSRSLSGWVYRTDAHDRAASLGSDSNAVLAQTFDPDTYREGFCRIDLTTGAAIPLFEESKSHSDNRGAAHIETAYPLSVVSPPAYLTANGKTIIYAAQSHDAPSDLWIADLGSPTSVSRHITDVNPGFQDARSMAQLLTWKTADGQMSKGVLFLPTGTTKAHRVPIICGVYPGRSLSLGLNEYHNGVGILDANDFLAHGFGVLVPDMVLERVGDDVTQMTGDLLPAVDAAVATGLVDGDHVGIFGHSYGGGTVNKVITQTSRFYAACSAAGVASEDFAYLYQGNQDYMESTDAFNQEAMGSSLWEHPERYIKNSPIYHLDKVTTPLLLVHGDSDGNVKPENSEMMFEGLSHLGKEVVFAKYKGMNHVPSPGAEQNDVRDRIVAWFEQHLKSPVSQQARKKTAAPAAEASSSPSKRPY